MLTLNEALKAAGLTPKASTEEKKPEAASVQTAIVQEEQAAAEDKPLTLNEARKLAGLKPIEG